MTLTQSITTWTSEEPLNNFGSSANLLDDGSFSGSLTELGLASLFETRLIQSLPEGTVILHSGDGSGPSYLATDPDEKIEVELGPHCWEELKEKIGDDLYFGFLNYEMGCYSDPQTVPHAKLKRGAIFYRPTKVMRIRALPKGPFSAKLVGASETFESYQEKVLKIKEHIRKGDVYQVNLSQELRFEVEGLPLSLFAQVSEGHPYSAFVQTDRETLVSASPELFVKKVGHTIWTEPIKGTAPRGVDEQEDNQLKKQLQESQKDRAELMMIVDLLRNDLHRICKKVEVEKLCQLESFPTVSHLVSRLRGELKEDLHPIDILKPLFPGGSISGCPKLAALELISELEGQPRGPYTGAIGFIHGQEMHFNLAIRTAVIEENQMRLRLGGAIVADSDPLLEYQETLHKGKAFCTSISMANFSKKTQPPSPSETAACSLEMASSPQ